MPTAPSTTETSSGTFSDPARREFQAFRRLGIATVMLSCAICVSLNLAAPDRWRQVLYSQERLSSGSRDATVSIRSPAGP